MSENLISRKDTLDGMKKLSAVYDAETVQRCIEIVSNAPMVDAIPVSYFAEELNLIREILARRKDLPMEYRRELEAEKKYLRDWINHWRYESDQGFYGVQWKALSEDEIIAKRKEE